MTRNGMMHETDVGSVASANNSVGMINGSGTHASAGAHLAQAMAGSGVLVFLEPVHNLQRNVSVHGGHESRGVLRTSQRLPPGRGAAYKGAGIRKGRFDRALRVAAA